MDRRQVAGDVTTQNYENAGGPFTAIIWQGTQTHRCMRLFNFKHTNFGCENTALLCCYDTWSVDGIKIMHNRIIFQCDNTSDYCTFPCTERDNIAFLISNFRHVLNVVCFLMRNSPAYEFYMPKFRNTLFHLHRQVDTKFLHLPACEDGTESVPKRRHIKFRCREITQKRAYKKL